jgi:hypothetical protein
MHAYVCLFICLWFMTSSEGKNLLELYGMEEREVVRRNFGIEGDLCI